MINMINDKELVEQVDSDLVNVYAGIVRISMKSKQSILKYNLIKPKLKSQWKDLLYDMLGK